MPGMFDTGYELHNLSISAYQKMGRNLDTFELLEICVPGMIQRICKKLLDGISAVFVGREADIVYDKQIYCRPWRTRILVGRDYMQQSAHPSLCINFQSALSLSVMDKRSMR